MITQTEQRRRKAISVAKIKHGCAGNASGTKSRSIEYQAWISMMARCTNPEHKDYAKYGGRGITVCDEWRAFAQFAADMGQRSSRAYSIERKDNDLGYGPDNCRWATRKEQARNRASTIWVAVDGKQVTLTEACSLIGVPYDRVRGRLRLGWNMDDALTP
jgi:hypothetical protein